MRAASRLSVQGVSLVFEPASRRRRRSASDRRSAAHPRAVQPAAGRRARSTCGASGRCIEFWSPALAGRAIELRVLQYGVTRESLRDAAGRRGLGRRFISPGTASPARCCWKGRTAGPTSQLGGGRRAASGGRAAAQARDPVGLPLGRQQIQQTMSWLGIAPADAGRRRKSGCRGHAAKQVARSRAQRSRGRWPASARLRGAGDALRGRGRVRD